MESIWRQSVSAPKRPSLSKDIYTDVAIIGGGMAGILIGWFLKEKGIDSVILEASKIGGGQTENTTAKITAQHGDVYHTLIEKFGKEKAFEYAKANSVAVDDYYNLIKKLDIDCHFQYSPSYIYSTSDRERIEKEIEACIELGLPAEFTLKTSLPFSVEGAAVLPNQAQFNPLEFLNAVADKLNIFENTAVVKVLDNCLETDKGKVKAKKIVFATHYPFINSPGFYFMRMHQERSYVIALENTAELDGMYYGIDDDGLSFRSYENTLLLGGGGHRTGENRKGGRYDKLFRAALEFWPNCKEVTRWSAQDCMTLDGVPYIGCFSSSKPNWYVATGFQKWGMTHSMVAAKRICGLITGDENEDSIFSPLRFTPSASAKTFLDEGVHAVKDLSKQILAPPRAKVEELPKGHGGIVEYQGEKVGVYKSDDGEIYAVSTRCPHLGCQLEWNPDEKSWDCPCHGSRFDYKGTLIDNPAQKNLPTTK